MNSSSDAAERLTEPAYHRAWMQQKRWDGKRAASLAYNEEMSSLFARENLQTGASSEVELFRALEADLDGAVVVTSTIRAARALRQHYDRWQRAQGNAGWKSPRILAWEPWLRTLWDAAVLNGAEGRVLLSDVQELALWQRVLAQDEAAMQTLSAAALAGSAQRAWTQMHQYRIGAGQLRNEDSVDAKAFARWVAEFEKLCRKGNLLSPALMETAMAQGLASQEIPLPENIFLVGFDRVTPAQTWLVSAMEARGCGAQFVELQPVQELAAQQTVACARTLDDEIVLAARWIRRALIENPTLRIGVIVPGLEQMRGAIETTFRRVLAPGSMDVRGKQSVLPYEFSLGTAMRRMPQIRTALTLLRWMQAPIAAEEISWLLVHGGFGGRSGDGSGGGTAAATDARDARAMLDRKFREREFQMGGAISLGSFLQWLARAATREELMPLRRTMERLAAAVGRYALEKPRSFAEWGEAVEEMLATAEWHLLKPEASAEYQLLRRWNVLLNELSSLSSVTGAVRFRRGLEKLEELAAQMLFTLETQNAPVQILGVAESAGMVFDAVWWMNVQASAWPLRGKAQPFLPWSLQRDARMPYADPTEDAAFALRVTKRILHSAQTAVVSFALQGTDAANASSHVPGAEIVVSPLVWEALPEMAMVTAEEFLPEMKAALPVSLAMEQVREEAVVPFQGTKIGGGVKFLELHSACPFRAFAELRLGTRPLEDLSEGLSPRDQGTILHRVLDAFWKEVQSQRNLLASTGEQHRASLRGHIAQALEEFFAHANEPWQKALLTIEAKRLEERLLQWLEEEKQRADFTVLTTEAAMEDVSLAGIALRCRVDRIDRVAEGLVLLDYKTGDVKAAACDGERPDQPQLPAYAVLRKRYSDPEDVLAGVAFASVHPRRIGFEVVGSLASVFSAATETEVEEEKGRRNAKRNSAALTAEEMQQLQEVWSTTVTRLAEEFRAGAVMVDPKEPAVTCRYCAQTLLCRIRETVGVMAEAGEEE